MTTAITSSGCSVKPALSFKARTVSVNGVVLTKSAIAQEIQNHPASKPTEAWLAAARALTVRELLLQEARRIGITPAPIEDDMGRRETSDEAVVRMLVSVEVKTPEADDSICRRYYDANPQRFRSSDLCEVRHILLAAAPGDQTARTEIRSRAEEIRAQLQCDPLRFGFLANFASACPSSKIGGSLGQIGPGQTVPEFEAGLARLNEGEVALIETRYGIHVVLVDRRISGRSLPFEFVRDRIAGWLNEKVRRQAIRQYIAILAGRADIVGIDLASSQSPLVQ